MYLEGKNVLLDSYNIAFPCHSICKCSDRHSPYSYIVITFCTLHTACTCYYYPAHMYSGQQDCAFSHCKHKHASNHKHHWSASGHHNKWVHTLDRLWFHVMNCRYQLLVLFLDMRPLYIYHLKMWKYIKAFTCLPNYSITLIGKNLFKLTKNLQKFSLPTAKNLILSAENYVFSPRDVPQIFVR